MANWGTRISRAAMMGLAWAAVWVPFGAAGARLFVSELDPEHIGGPLYAGFICGTFFSALAGIASGRRRLDELSPYRAAAWGAMSGLCVGALFFVLAEIDGREHALWVTNELKIAIVAITAIVAGISSRRPLGVFSFSRAAAWGATAGLLVGALPLTLESEGQLRLLPVAVIGTLTVLGALSGCVSVPLARWLKSEPPHQHLA